MKKLILFSFLVLALSPQGFAQDSFDDEFADPSLQTFPAPELQPARTPLPTQQNPLPSETEIPSRVATEEEFAPLSEPIDAFAQPQLTESLQPKFNDVVLENQVDLTASYKQRRARHGVLFSINYEKYFPADYFSQYRDVKIDKIKGADAANLLGAELGYKFNFQLGSLALLFNYASGGTEGVAVGAGKRTLDFTRYGASINLALDNVLQEPWIVPYAQIGLHQFHVIEDDDTKFDPNDATQPLTMDQTTQIAMNYRFGVLFQLNWIEKAIDPNTQIDGLRSSGLQNTYLDVFMVSHLASAEVYDPMDAVSEGDPDLASEMELGLGLKLEF